MVRPCHRMHHAGNPRPVSVLALRRVVRLASHPVTFVKISYLFLLGYLAESIEEILHNAGLARFFLPLHSAAAISALDQERLERAIGGLYLPRSERQSHYFHARLASQFDAVIHIDQTSAVQPLGPVSRGAGGEVAETFPVGV